MENDIYEIIKIILRKKGMNSVEVLTPETKLREDLNFDSLDLAELTVRIEDKFGVDIFENGNVYTVEDILEKIRRKKVESNDE